MFLGPFVKHMKNAAPLGEFAVQRDGGLSGWGEGEHPSGCPSLEDRCPSRCCRVPAVREAAPSPVPRTLPDTQVLSHAASRHWQAMGTGHEPDQRRPCPREQTGWRRTQRRVSLSHQERKDHVGP